MLPEETSPEVREALEELHLYLSDVLPPLVVAESFKLLLKFPPGLMASNIESWTAMQHRSGSGIKVSDYLFYAVKKVYLIGEFRLVTKGPFAGFFAELIRLVAASCPPDEREALLHNLKRLGEATGSLTASVDELIRGKGWAPSAPTQGLPLSADELQQLRRFSILLERFDARHGTPQADSVRTTELLAHALAMAARTSRSTEEFEKNLQKMGLQMETGEVFRALAAGLPGWPPPPPAPEGSEEEKVPVQESAPLAAIHRIVEQPEEPGEVALRFNEMVKTACERFNEGALPQAVTLLDLAERIVKEKKVDSTIVDAVRQKVDESLDVERLRRYAEVPRQHLLLRRVLNFFLATRPAGLLSELLRETKRERRKLILQLLEVHGAPARQEALARLQSAFGKGEGDENWYFRRNLLYLLRRIPASGQGGLAPEEDVEIASRHASLQIPAALLKEAIANLGQLRHEKAEKKLIALLVEIEKMLIKPGPAAPIDPREGRLLLDRVVSALARFGTPEARRAVVEHGLMKKKAELGDTMARLSELAGQDLSGDGESLESLLAALKANTPRRVFGIVLSQNESNAKHIIDALSTTPSETVREALGGLARKFEGLEIGKAATRALATLDSAGQVPEAHDTRSGEIEIFGLPALVQGLADSGASGLLRLKDPRGDLEAEIVLLAGRMKSCEARSLSGETAFYELLERPAPASYTFERQPDAKNEPAADKLPEFAPLCLEGMRRHDELGQAAVVVPDDARFSKTQVRPEHHPVELDGMFVNGLWNLIAGGATPKDCEGALKADSFRIRRQLAHWVETGALALE
jgi:hypothetical protein